MKIGRLLRHLFATHWATRRHFSADVLGQIEAAVKAAEARHVGEIRFVVETALDFADLWHDLAPRMRALQVFGDLGVWDTAGNNGVLIYVLLADHVVEIIADRGIAARVSEAEWAQVCSDMQRDYGAQRFAAGSVAGVRGVGALLAQHFPGAHTGTDELPNQPVLL